MLVHKEGEGTIRVQVEISVEVIHSGTQRDDKS